MTTPELKVVGISQMVMFNDNVQLTQLILEKKEGQQFAVPISDQQAVEIIEIATGEQGNEQASVGSPISDETEAGTQL